MRWRAMKSTRRRLVPTIISAIYILLVPTIALVGSAPAPCVPTVRFCTLTAATDGAHKCASVLLLLPPMAHTSRPCHVLLPPMAHTSALLYSYCCHRWLTQVRFSSVSRSTQVPIGNLTLQAHGDTHPSSGLNYSGATTTTTTPLANATDICSSDEVKQLANRWAEYTVGLPPVSPKSPLCRVFKPLCPTCSV